MNNLSSNSKNPGDQKPHQFGKAKGTKKSLLKSWLLGGTVLEVQKEWMFDTGASVSAITKSNADQFQLTPIGATASGTTGGGGIIMKTGLTMIFSVIDSAGLSKDVQCSLAVGVKPNDAGSEIIGMDQLSHVNAKINWDPGTKTGQLYE
jgi:hypothetical protein